MTFRACARGTEVARAAREGRRSSELDAHVAGCADCREAARIASWLQAAARASVAAARPPDPAGLHGRALLEREIARRRDLARRAARPARLFQRVGGIAGVAATAAWILRGGTESRALGGLAGPDLADPTLLAVLAATIAGLALVAALEALPRLDRS